MKTRSLYEQAAYLNELLRGLARLIRTANEHGSWDAADKFNVQRMHIESKLRHLNHHILKTEA